MKVCYSLLRTLILSLAVQYQLPEAEERVKSMFQAWLNGHGKPGSKHIQQDLRNLVYYHGKTTQVLLPFYK